MKKLNKKTKLILLAVALIVSLAMMYVVFFNISISGKVVAEDGSIVDESYYEDCVKVEFNGKKRFACKLGTLNITGGEVNKQDFTPL